jgi:tetratricopeptide (TPR) repeat protein
VGGSSTADDSAPAPVSWAAIAAEPQAATVGELPEGFRRASSPTAGYPESLPLPWPNTNLHDPVSLYLPSGMADGPLRTVPADESNAEPSGGPAGAGSGSTAPVPDFIGTVDNMKNILKMPYSQDAVTMAVYRVGRTIVMDGADMVAETDRLESTPRKPKRRVRRTRSQQDPIVPVAPVNPFSALAQHDEQDEEDEENGTDPAAARALRSAQHPLVCDAGPAVKSNDGEGLSSIDKPDDGETSRPSSSESGGSSSSLTSKFVDHTIATQRALDAKSPAMQSTESTSLPHMPKRSRNVHRQLDDLHLLLRADNVLLSGAGHPKVGLRMRDLTEGPMTTDGALDLWMDNMLSDVPESVICWHEKGLLKGYLMMRTEDIPAMSGYAFEPAKVKTDALSVLRWMQQTCTRESSTYVLHRNSNDGELKMFDLQTINQLGGAAAKSSSEQHIAASYSVGMMCYRTAGCLSHATREEIGQPTPELRAKRVRALYKQALELLDGDTYPEERARAHEKLADTFIAPNDLTSDADDTDSVYSETHLSEVSLTESEKSDESADAARPAPTTLVCEQREQRSVRARELLEGGAHLTDALETLERQGMAGTSSYMRLRHKAISCATAAAATQCRNGEFRAALDTLQNIFSRPDVIGRHSGEFGTPPPHAGTAGPSDQGEQLQFVSLVCELLATLADVYMGLTASSELDSPDTVVTEAKAGTFSLPSLQVAVMAPFSVLDKRKCLELAMLNFRTAAFGLRTALLHDPNKPKQDSDAGVWSHTRGNDGMPAAVRGKRLLAVLWRKLGDASNELGQLSLKVGELPSAEQCFENALSAFDRVDDAENCAIMTLNLAAVLRRKAYAEFVDMKHLTLAQRQLYVKAITLYERALASLGPRRKQQGDRRTKLDRIRSIVQIELAGVYTAFAQQLQAGGRVSLDEGKPAASAPDDADQHHPPGQDNAGHSGFSKEEEDGSAAGMYIVDEDVVPDLLRKALEIYSNHNQSAKLCSVHAALGRHYLNSVELAATVGQNGEKNSATEAKRIRGKAERAMSHLERALSFASSVPSEGDGGAGEICRLLAELSRLHRLLPGCGHLNGDAEVSSLRSALHYLVRAQPVLQDVHGAGASKLRELVLQSARDTLREMTKALTSQLGSRGDASDTAQELARYKGIYRQALIGSADGVDELLQAIVIAEAQS